MARATARGVSVISVLGALCAAGLLGGCAHANAGAARLDTQAAEASVAPRTGSGGDAAAAPIISEGKYAVESIRSRATVDGVDLVLEISEKGAKMKDRSGAEHTLTERGALTLSEGGVCQLALAVSVDGEAPGISERACTWSVEGDKFVLGESAMGTRTQYRIQKDGDRLVLEGVSDLDASGAVVGDASGERIVLVQGRGPLGTSPSASSAGTEDTSSSSAAGLSADEI